MTSMEQDTAVVDTPTTTTDDVLDLAREARRIAREGGTDTERQEFAERKAKVLARISPTFTPEERLHPDWCGFEAPCTDGTAPGAPIHYGRRMAWFPPQEDGARVDLVLGYGEESQSVPDPISEGCRWIDLSITTRPDDDPVTVSLSADDARFLARELKAYAKQLDHDPAWMTRGHLGMTCVEYAVDTGILTQHADGTVSLSTAVKDESR